MLIDPTSGTDIHSASKNHFHFFSTFFGPLGSSFGPGIGLKITNSIKNCGQGSSFESKVTLPYCTGFQTSEWVWKGSHALWGRSFHTSLGSLGAPSVCLSWFSTPNIFIQGV